MGRATLRKRLGELGDVGLGESGWDVWCRVSFETGTGTDAVFVEGDVEDDREGEPLRAAKHCTNGTQANGNAGGGQI